ncbi:hypothetical protein MKW94_015441 [Papaver nudicaule]|uniref:Germin-like protein n=1 Tax=Papaver nudicaule TaxID=74823 RepID=A0AA42AX16_PAPNU|nr:hypothetical protein [Papaver nudicaule]
MKTLISCLFIVFFFGTSMVASDPDMLQDICVADLSSAVKMNGFACKAASNITAQDFFFAGLSKPGNITNAVGSLVIPANVERIPGLNTLGISMSRVDYLPGGLNPPHTHPRATEIVFVLEGSIDVGFITTGSVLISKTIHKGEVFVFPKGLVHFQKSNGDKPASALAAFNSQFPGTQSMAMALFGAKPAVPDNVLAQAFQIDAKEVQTIKSKFAPK